MAPVKKEQNESFVDDLPSLDQLKDPELLKPMSFRMKDVVWKRVIFFIVFHVLACIAVYRAVVDPNFKWQTMFYLVVQNIATGTIGVVIGVHRYWSHRSFKANLPFRLIMAFFQTLSMQQSIYHWCRNHRLHHKYSDTNADPHNVRRGFFYSQLGWAMLKKTDLVKQKGKSLMLTDLLNDPIVRFQNRFYEPLVILCAIVVTFIPYYLWNESLMNSFLLCFCYSYIHVLTLTGFVNSFAHRFGTRPYDNNIVPTESWIAIHTSAEGYHNYHHVFPWDYSASELDPAFQINLPTLIIDQLSKIGWTYDLKKPSKQMIEDRKLRTGGEGSTYVIQNNIHHICLALTSISITFIPLLISMALRYIIT